MTQSNSPASVVLNPIKYLEKLPEFSGDKRDLYTFITLVDRIHPVLQQYDQTSQMFFSDLIKSRLKGKARETMEINFHVQSWTDIKDVLVNNFGERLSIEELFDKLRAVVFRTTTIDFYNEIREKLRSINNKISIQMGVNTESQRAAEGNTRAALLVFKAKIPEPMKTILACRNPSTLENAMEILFQAGYANYGILSNKNNTSKPAEPRRTETNKVHTANYNKPPNPNTSHVDGRKTNNQYGSTQTQNNNNYNNNRNTLRTNNYTAEGNRGNHTPNYGNNSFNGNDANFQNPSFHNQYPNRNYNNGFTSQNQGVYRTPNTQPPLEPMDVNMVVQNNEDLSDFEQQDTTTVEDNNTYPETSAQTDEESIYENFHFQACPENYLI